MNRKIIIYIALYFITFTIIGITFFSEPRDLGKYKWINDLITFFLMFLTIKYIRSVLLIVIAPWNRVVRKIREKRFLTDSYRPMVSIIIPAYNEEVGILNTINSVLASKYKNIEIIVVNDGSADKSHKKMLDFLSKNQQKILDDGIEFRYYYQKNGGKGRALNNGIRNSNGEIIITIDADSVVDNETIGNFVKAFSDPTVDAAVGNVKIGNTDTIVGVVQYLEFLSSFYIKNSESVMGTIYIIGGAAAAFRKRTFDVVGLYDYSNITEDIEISVRICENGMKTVYMEDAIVYTEGAVDIKGLASQRLRWKTGWFQTMYAHKDIIFSRNKKHNKILTWFMIPFVYVSTVQLFFEPWFILLLYAFSIITWNFTSFLAWISVETVTMLLILFLDKKTIERKMFLLAPITWLLFYISMYIEYRSLIYTAWNSWKKKELKWQKWQRTGVGVNVVEKR